MVIEGRARRSSTGGPALLRLVVMLLLVPGLVIALGATTSGGAARDADGGWNGMGDGAWRVEPAVAAVTGRAVLAVRASPSPRTTLALVGPAVALMGLAATWRRPRRTRERSRSLAARRRQAPRGPPPFAVV